MAADGFDTSLRENLGFGADASNRQVLLFFGVCVVTWIWATSIFRLDELGRAGAASYEALPLFIVGCVFWLALALANLNEKVKAAVERLRGKPGVFAACALIGAAGEFLAHGSPVGTGWLATVLGLVGVACATIAFAAETLLLWTCYRHLGMRNAVVFLLTTFAGAALAMLALLPLTSLPLRVLLPPLAFALLWFLQKPFLNRAPAAPDDYVFRLANKNGIANFLLGVSLGLFLVVYDQGFFTRHTVWLILAAALAGTVLTFLTRSLQQQNPNVATFEIGIPLVALSWLALAVGLPWDVCFVLQLSGLLYTLFINEALLVLMTGEYAIPPNPVLFNYSYLALGLALGLVVARLTGGNGAVLAPAMIFVLLFSCACLVRDRKLKFGWVVMRADAMDMSRDFFRYACTAVGRECKLTAREQEILLLLATGHSRSSISRELFIGEETVKSHAKSIYRKLGVHSRQELIDFVTEKAASLARE